jgi:hypothetical protein
MALDTTGRPSLTLAGPDPAQPTPALEIDDKGARVGFGRPAGGASYLSLSTRVSQARC